LISLQRAVKLAKFATALSATMTAGWAAIVIALQFSGWQKSGLWEWYRLSSIVDQLSGVRRGEFYVVADVRLSEIEASLHREAFDWLLETPALALLLFILALHLALRLYLASVEKKV
jgi:hypothetical protein